MAGKKPDPDILLKHAAEIHALGDVLRASAESLRKRIENIGGSENLVAEAGRDALSAETPLREISDRLGREADALAALACAYRSMDDPAIDRLIREQGEDGFLRAFLPALARPELEGFEPYFLAQTRMVASDWAQVYVQGPGQLTQTDTYHTGRIVEQVIGLWVNPRSKKKYHVFDLGGGKPAFTPDGKLSPPIDLSEIPNRGGLFADGQRGEVSDLWNPPAAGGRRGDWRNPGDPWQNFIIGNMRVTGLKGAIFPVTPHANLCGELSVFFALGEPDLEAGLTRFAQLKGLGYWNIDGKKTEYTGTQVLQNVNHASSSYDLKRLFEAYKWKAQIRNGTMPMPDEVSEWLRSGRKIICLTELDTRSKIQSKQTGEWIDNPDRGRLVPGSSAPAAGRAAHWVAVTDVFQDGKEAIRVEVMNTYSGCRETYAWETFSRTCKNPGPSAGSYTFIEAAEPTG